MWFCELLGINFKCLDNISIEGGWMVFGYFLEMLNMELIFVREINFNYLNKLIIIWRIREIFNKLFDRCIWLVWYSR